MSGQSSFELSAEKRALLEKLLREEGLEQKQAERIGSRPDPRAPAPLSTSQQRIWIVEQFLSDSPLYNVPAAVRIQGPIEPKALEASLRRLVERHEILRTSFTAEDSGPVQVVHPTGSLSLRVADASDWQEALSQARGEFQKPFDLTRGPLLRAALWRLTGDDNLFLLSMHHIISDGVTIRILFAELEELYREEVQGTPTNLPEVELQMGDFAVWQKSWLESETIQEQLGFWKENLSGRLPFLELPLDRARPATQTFRGAWRSREFAPELLPALEGLARSKNATLFMTLLAGFQALLFRYTREEDILVGSPAGMRTRVELENMPGFFVNMVALRTAIDGRKSFAQHLENVRETALAAFANQEVPFELVVDAVQPERNLSQPPIFQVLYDHRRSLASGLNLEGTRSSQFLDEEEMHSGTTKVDLCLYTEEREGRLIASFEYNTDLFDESTIDRLLEHLEVLLGAAGADSQRTLDELEILPEWEERRLLREWNATSSPFDDDTTLHEVVARWARETPDAPALESYSESITYREFDARANQVAHRLIELGVRCGDPVALYHERCTDLFIGMLGILKAGAAYVPMDPSYPAERLTTMLEDSEAPAVVTQEKLADRLDLGTSATVRTDADQALLAAYPETDPEAGARAEDPVYVLYTSGSTGRPKGVRVAHRNVLRLMKDPHWSRLTPDMRIVQITPISFDASIVDIWSGLLNGGCVVPFPRQTPDIEVLKEVVQDHRINTLFLASALFNTVIDEAPEVFEHIEQVSSGGEAMSLAHVRRLQRRYPKIRITNCYGPTETSVMATVYVPPCPLPEQLTTIPIGIPCENTTAYVLDPNLEPVPIGVAGELYIGGPAVSLGYLGRPELNAERFLTDPFSTQPGARLYRTGDQARWMADGNLDFLGRNDDQVKVRGHRIELGEIESLLADMDEVRQAVVLAREDVPGEKRIVAYAVCEEGKELTHADVDRHLKSHLPEYMVPTASVFLEEMPLTPGGKVDRRSLPEPQASVQATYVAPRTPTEELLAQQWAGVLDLSKVGVHDDFFELGGHSLTATILIARLRKELGVEIPLKSFFQGPTIAQMAAHADRRNAASERLPEIPRSEPTQGPAPLSLNQEGLWFLQKLAPESPFYNVPIRMPLDGPVDGTILHESLREIVRRHESLRTHFHQEGDADPHQVVGDVDLEWSVHDLVDAGAEQDARVAEIERDLAVRPFDLSRDPLLRAAWIQLAPDRSLLSLNIHHIVFDGWSMDVLGRELALLYAAHCEGACAALPELTIQYADYARWQREQLEDPILEELAYWTDALRGTAPVLELPTDRPRPQVQTWNGAHVRRELSAELTERVREVARAHSCTVFMTLLAASQTLLSRYSGQKDFVFGSPVAGRSRPEIEEAIGLYLNIVVLRARLEDDPSFSELMRRARESTLSAHEHQNLPFESLVNELSPSRDLSTTPIYQVLFSLRTPAKPTQAGDVTFGTPLEIDTGSAKTDLAITVDDDGGPLGLQLTYNTDLFQPASIERMAEHLVELLESATREPATPVSLLEMIGERERLRLLVDWNGARTDYPERSSVGSIFQEVAQAQPERQALALGERSMDYGQLDRRSNQLAQLLLEHGVQRGARVALCMDRSLEMVVAILAILKTGAAYVPLDPTYPRERLAFMLEDTQAPILIATRALAEELPESEARLLVAEDIWPQLDDQPDEAVEVSVSPDDAAYVMYTSGSTGRPKGVEIPHRGILRLVFQEEYATFDSERVFLQLAPISFDASTFELWGALLHGARLAIFPDRVPSVESLGEALEQHGVTTLWLTAALFNSFVDEKPEIFAGLSELLTGGEALSVPHIRRAHAALPASVQLINGYGPTESTTFTCCYRIPRDLPEDLSSIPIGHPIANTSVLLLDEKGRLSPQGIPGELHIGGDGLATGYLGREELTREKFVPNPLGKGRLYRTGDLARHLPDGTIEFLGRNDFQVKIRGFRIELGEIEIELAKHPGVESSVVTVHEEPSAGKRLVAYVVRSAGRTIEGSELAQHLKASLPDYMVPSAFQFLEAIPITANGKVDRKALPEPVFQSGEPAGGHVAPRNEVERHLAELWERVLGVENIGVEDDFFELGGHSLLAVKLLNEVKDVFGQDLPLTSLISAPTIYEQGQALHLGVGASASSSLVKIQPKGERPPVFCVCSLGGTVLNQRPLAKRLGNDQPFYGLQALNLEEELGRPASIEEYAERYIEVIRQVEPNGPYVIGGHSFGGVVSYEIAQRLLAQGAEVAMLFILDSALPNLGPGSMAEKMSGLFAFLRGLPHVPQEALERFRRDPDQFKRSLRQKLRFTATKLRGGRTSTPAPGAPNGAPSGEQELQEALYEKNSGLRTEDIVDMTHWPENNRRIAARHYRAVLGYEPSPYPGAINLFRSRFHSLSLGMGMDLGWKRVAARGVQVHTVPGGHLSILTPPNVDVLATKMRAELDRRFAGQDRRD